MANDMWRTPPEVFNYFNKDYNFQCDVAASDDNHLVDWYYTERTDGLNSIWIDTLDAGDYVWCNPPYSNPLPWVAKCIWESRYNGIGSVLLLNMDMSTRWAELLLSVNCTIITLTGGRIAFLNEHGKPIKGNNKGQVVYIIPPFTNSLKSPTTEYLKLSKVMKG
jgi:phage N-6-adenine-methyltransferase